MSTSHRPWLIYMYCQPQPNGIALLYIPGTQFTKHSFRPTPTYILTLSHADQCMDTQARREQHSKKGGSSSTREGSTYRPGPASQTITCVVWRCNGFSKVKVKDLMHCHKNPDILVLLEAKEPVVQPTTVQGYVCKGIPGYI